MSKMKSWSPAVKGSAGKVMAKYQLLLGPPLEPVSFTFDDVLEAGAQSGGIANKSKQKADKETSPAMVAAVCGETSAERGVATVVLYASCQGSEACTLAAKSSSGPKLIRAKSKSEALEMEEDFCNDSESTYNASENSQKTVLSLARSTAVNENGGAGKTIVNLVEGLQSFDDYASPARKKDSFVRGTCLDDVITPPTIDNYRFEIKDGIESVEERTAAIGRIESYKAYETTDQGIEERSTDSTITDAEEDDIVSIGSNKKDDGSDGDKPIDALVD
jgi:hypothetical protein